MATAEIVTIGTELLLGEINDTNSRYIARALRDIGVDIYRITSVGDNASRITATLQEALMRSDFVITTGGLGPTVDDPPEKPSRMSSMFLLNINLNYGMRFLNVSPAMAAHLPRTTSVRHLCQPEHWSLIIP